MSANHIYHGEMEGHNGWVTSLAANPEDKTMLVSGSRDKTLIIWKLKKGRQGTYGTAAWSLTGHNHFVEDVVLSSDGQFALSASSDKTLRLWNLETRKTHKRFTGHTDDVLSVAFSADNRQIVSGSRDHQVKLWNTIGQCKYTIKDKPHSDWVSCVKFSPSKEPVCITSGWDNLVKVWDLQSCKLKHNLEGHTGHVNTVAVSPDGSLCASGGEDGKAMLWDLHEGKQLHVLEAGDVIHSLLFSPNRYWLCGTTQSGIKIWNLQSKKLLTELKPEFPGLSKKAITPFAVSIAWSVDGTVLFAGYTDHVIRVWEFPEEK